MADGFYVKRHLRYAVARMLVTLQGRITEVFLDFFILEVSGLGYRLRAHTGTLSNLSVGGDKRVYLHEQIREDAYDLYAFLSMDELEFFEKLLSVSGVGPKVAMAVCAAAPLDNLKSRLAQGDADWLASLPGLGKKTAQKIVLELKGKLVEVGVASDVDRELIEALTNLGYTAFQAREAAKKVPVETGDTSVRLRATLKLLSK
ncbi:MAG: Holliday junction branch migration protein RuvA [Candidatus Portnoybacteria bacterium]|nr:Holliday junction branch migration protein RuvA [Candidatus Portnoybacteria bacterium]